MKKLTMKVGLVFVTLFFTIAASAASITQVISFGDSLSDNGNLFADTGGTVPPAPYWNGRFSNGPVWVETLAASLGVGLDGYARGGATTGGGGVTPPLIANSNDPTGAFGFMGLQDEIGAYLGNVGGVADPNALYTVWASANDFLIAPDSASAIAAIGPAITNMLTAIGTLVAAGAQHFVLPNLPDLGLTPLKLAEDLITPGASAGASGLMFAFNTSYYNALDATFGAGFGTRLDTFTILQDVVANPGTYGLTNVTDMCFDATVPSMCADPSQYAFWDPIHPTAALHDILAAEAFAAVVPVPAAVWLFGSALGLLGWMRRSR